MLKEYMENFWGIPFHLIYSIYLVFLLNTLDLGERVFSITVYPIISSISLIMLSILVVVLQRKIKWLEKKSQTKELE